MHSRKPQRGLKRVREEMSRERRSRQTDLSIRFDTDTNCAISTAKLFCLVLTVRNVDKKPLLEQQILFLLPGVLYVDIRKNVSAGLLNEHLWYFFVNDACLLRDTERIPDSEANRLPRGLTCKAPPLCQLYIAQMPQNCLTDFRLVTSGSLTICQAQLRPH
ncbi:hypothetical protein ACTXT7_004970 [Hymenolepis weldensis]